MMMAPFLPADPDDGGGRSDGCSTVVGAYGCAQAAGCSVVSQSVRQQLQRCRWSAWCSCRSARHPRRWTGSSKTFSGAARLRGRHTVDVEVIVNDSLGAVVCVCVLQHVLGLRTGGQGGAFQGGLEQGLRRHGHCVRPGGSMQRPRLDRICRQEASNGEKQEGILRPARKHVGVGSGRRQPVAV